MSHGAVTSGWRQVNDARRAKAAFVEFLGPEAATLREAQIAALPSVTWTGKPLKTLRCHGTTGKGPHDCNVPEGLLWALISLEGFHCVYHGK